jgi:hypothetical protein
MQVTLAAHSFSSFDLALSQSKLVAEMWSSHTRLGTDGNTANTRGEIHTCRRLPVIIIHVSW